MKIRQPLTHVAEWWVLLPLRLGWLVLHLITPRNGSLQSLWQSRHRTISRIFHLGQQLAHYLRGHFKGRGGNDHLVDLVNFSSSISPKCLISSEKMIPKPQLPRCIFEYSNFASIYWQCSCLECNRQLDQLEANNCNSRLSRKRRISKLARDGCIDSNQKMQSCSQYLIAQNAIAIVGCLECNQQQLVAQAAGGERLAIAA